MSQTLYTDSGKTDLIHISLADTKSTCMKRECFLLQSKEEHKAQQYTRNETYSDNCDSRVNVVHMRTKDTCSSLIGTSMQMLFESSPYKRNSPAKGFRTHQQRDSEIPQNQLNANTRRKCDL